MGHGRVELIEGKVKGQHIRLGATGARCYKRVEGSARPLAPPLSLVLACCVTGYRIAPNFRGAQFSRIA